MVLDTGQVEILKVWPAMTVLLAYFKFIFFSFSETRFVDDIVEVDEAGSSNAVGGNGNSSMMCTPSCLTCPVSLEVLCDRSSMHGGNHLILQ